MSQGAEPEQGAGERAEGLTSDEWREMSDRLSVSEARLRMATSAAGIGTWEVDLADNHASCDERTRTILGIAAGVDISSPEFAPALHPDDRVRVERIVENLRAAARRDAELVVDVEFRIVEADSSCRWVWAVGRSLRARPQAHARHHMRIVGTMLDVTSRKRAEEALKDEAMLVQTLQHVGTALASKLDLPALLQTVTDEATLLTRAQFGAFFYNSINENGESFTLYTLSGAPREAFSRLPLPRNTPVFEPTFRGTAVVRSDDITSDSRYGRMSPHHGMPQGHLPVRSYLAVPVIARSGEVLGGLFFGHADTGVFTEKDERLVTGIAGWAAVAVDNARLYDAERTARRDADAARDEAEKANLAKTEFLATMSHELRTPLNAISGYVSLIEMGIRGPVTDQQRQDLQRIQRSQKQLLSLINDVLNFAKLEAGQVELEVRDIPVNSLMLEVEELATPQIEAKGLTYIIEKCSPELHVCGDREKLRQILLNLMSNAVKFTDAPGTIKLACVADQRLAHIRVSDTGRGITSERIATIFEPFVQINRHLTPATEQGVGLGLAISRELARAMHGDIAVQSEPDSGSTFTLSIPRGKAPEVVSAGDRRRGTLPE